MDPGETKALADIKEYGCHVIHVLEEGALPPFSYSVGIQRSSNAPEIIQIGLKRELGHSVVNEYNRRVRTGEVFEAGRGYLGFIQGFEVKFEPVDKSHYAQYLGWARWFYRGDAFDTLQVIYPTTSGVWPWDADASEWFKARQPLLTVEASGTAG